MTDLEKYGNHGEDCGAWKRGRHIPADCDCGYIKAIEAEYFVANNAKLLSFRNNGVELLYKDQNGILGPPNALELVSEAIEQLKSDINKAQNAAITLAKDWAESQASLSKTKQLLKKVLPVLICGQWCSYRGNCRCGNEELKNRILKVLGLKEGEYV